MQIQNLNDVPEMIKSGNFTEKEMINILAEYIQNNYPIFGLHNYDEDFRLEVITLFLEKGMNFIKAYKRHEGSFFTYFFFFIQCLIKSNLRKLENVKISDQINLEQSIDDYEVNYLEYSKEIEERTGIETLEDSKLFDKFKTSYPKTYQKQLLILALKSSYNLSDNYIEKISKICEIDKEELHKAILIIKKTLIPRMEKKRNLEDRRNTAYFHHKKYIKQLNKIQDSAKPNTGYQMDQINSKLNKQTSNWEKINERLNEGYIYLRPTNKTIADILGICERQVNYYLKRAKDLEND